MTRVTTKTVARLTELSIEVGAISKALDEAGFRALATQGLASASLLIAMGEGLLTSIVAERDAMLEEPPE